MKLVGVTIGIVQMTLFLAGFLTLTAICVTLGLSLCTASYLYTK